MDPPLIFGIAISIFFAFFFTCIEVAYLMVDKSEIEEDANAGSINGRIFHFFMRRPELLVGSTRVGYCAAIVVFSYFMAQLLLPIVAQMVPRAMEHTLITILLQIIFSTLLILLTAQFFPKVVGNIYPNRILLAFAIPFALTCLILFPLTYCILQISRFVITRIFHQEYDKDHPLFGITNLNQYFLSLTRRQWL